MANTSADVKLTVTQRAAIAALDQFQRRFEQMTNKMKKSTEATARETKKLNENWGKMPGFIARAVSGAYLFNEVMGQGKRMISEYLQSFTELAQKAEEARVTKVSYQEYLKQAIEIMPRDSDVTPAQFDRMMRGAGVSSPRNLTRGAMAAISATSELPVSERLKTVVELGQLRPELIKSFPGAFEDIVKTVVAGRARLKDPANTTYAQQQMINVGQSVSAVTDQRLYARNIAPLGYQLKDYGYNQAEAYAMASAFGLKTGETEGTITRTGILNMAKILHVEAQKAGTDKRGMDLVEYLSFDKGKEATRIRNQLLGAFSNDKDFLAAQRGLADMGMKNALRAPQLGQRAKTFLPVIDLLQGNTGKDSTWSLISIALEEMGAVKSGQYQANMPKTYARADKEYRAKAAGLRNAPFLSALFSREAGAAMLAESQLGSSRGEQADFLKKLIESMQTQGVPDPAWSVLGGAFTKNYRGKAEQYAAGWGQTLSREDLLKYAIQMVQDQQVSTLNQVPTWFGKDLRGRRMPDGRRLGNQELQTIAARADLVDLFTIFRDLNDTQVKALAHLEKMEADLKGMLQEAKQPKRMQVEGPDANPQNVGASE